MRFVIVGFVIQVVLAGTFLESVEAQLTVQGNDLVVNGGGDARIEDGNLLVTGQNLDGSQEIKVRFESLDDGGTDFAILRAGSSGGPELLLGTTSEVGGGLPPSTNTGRIVFRASQGALGAFFVAQDLELVSAGSLTGEDILRLYSRQQQQRYVVDSDDDEIGTTQFLWYADGEANSDRVMRLSNGNLAIAGTLTQNQNFDLAEAFLRVGPIEPGDLVSVVPGRPNAVRRAQGIGDPLLIGVASGDPGIVLGGSVFSKEELARVWGEEVAEDYEERSEVLVETVLRDRPELVRRQRALESLSASRAVLGGQRRQRVENDPEREEVIWKQKLADLASEIEGLALDRFHRERTVPVALAGRVPVRVDASQGSIEPGDSLTSGPVAGVAVRANETGSVVGVALEAFRGVGEGEVMMLVRPAGAGAPARRATLEPAAVTPPTPDRVAALEREVQELKAQLERLMGSSAPARLAAATRRPRSEDRGAPTAALASVEQ